MKRNYFKIFRIFCLISTMILFLTCKKTKDNNQTTTPTCLYQSTNSTTNIHQSDDMFVIKTIDGITDSSGISMSVSMDNETSGKVMLYLYPVDTNLTIYITLPVDSSGISRLGKGKYAILKNWTGDIENSVFTIINCPMRMYVEFKDQNGVQYTTSDQSSLSPYYNELTAIRYTGIGISIDGKGTTSEWMLTGNFNVIVFNPDKSKSKTISGKYNLSASGTHS